MKNRVRVAAMIVSAMMLASPAHASLFKGETLDTVAGAVSWVALVITPVVAISLFWFVHIMPEKVAEKRHHPQAKAIQVLCLLSLAFGGLLWPIAMLWAYSKPVLYRMAYGTETVAHEPPGTDSTSTNLAPAESPAGSEVESLRSKIAMLEAQLGQRSATS